MKCSDTHHSAKLSLKKIAGLVPSGSLTRFAPSPTGYLHLGHVASLLYLYIFQKYTSAKLLLRIEDHDAQRCKIEYERAIIDDLVWLGIIPDNINQFTQYQPTHFRQSDNLQVYRTYLLQLINDNLAYYCICSRADILKRESKTNKKFNEFQEICYDGFCRKNNRIDPPANAAAVRLLVKSENRESFIDGFSGIHVQYPSQQAGDLALQDRCGQYTYNYAVAIDDWRQNINLIVRGEDVLHCTGRQQMLRRIIAPADEMRIHYFHHPLLTDASGNKLSKRTYAESISSLRQQGCSKEEIFAAVLQSLKIMPKFTSIPLDAAVEHLLVD